LATQTGFFFLAHAQVAELSWAGFSSLNRGVLNAPDKSGVVLDTTGVLYLISNGLGPHTGFDSLRPNVECTTTLFGLAAAQMDMRWISTT
jgi:hypothetical protein